MLFFFFFVLNNIVSPEATSFLVFEMSSATNDVATLRRGILKTFEMMLNIDTETAVDANWYTPLH